ncbi:MAG: NADH:ubiquinone oxidoreductase subunit RnfD [Ruminococcaceae bacterium]|nr:NADH:ubiquinone oxidoreductase subunit RnfD [Oscillospiraceae bacterium]
MRSVIARDPCKIYFERFIFMAALLIPAWFLNGARVFMVSAVSVGVCIAADWVCCKVRKIPYDFKDYSVIFWGLAVSLVMPTSIPYVLSAFSAIICVVIGKHIFGGKENVVFSPPAIAAAFLIICYPSEMLYFPKVGEIMPVFGEYGGTLVRDLDNTLKLGNVPSYSMLDILMGRAPGAIGAVSILVIAVCAICMIIRHSTSICAMLSCLGTVSLLAFLYPRIDVTPAESVFYELTSGYLLFGVVFLAAEPYILPKRRAARIIYGIVLGYTTMMFRYFGQTEGCFLFALLITNALTPGFDTIIDNLLYWKRSYISSFESSKNDAIRGNIKLTDTQEIQLPEKYRYNTPPIDGKVKKHRRSKKHRGGDSDE